MPVRTPDQDDHYACTPADCDVAAAKRADAEMQSALEDAIRTGRVAAAEVILQMPHELGDEGWNAIADQAAEAGYDRSVVLRRRRPEGNFTALTIEAAYQYGYRRAAEMARGVARPNPPCTCAPDVNDGDPGTWCMTCRQGPRAAALTPPESAQRAEPFYPDDDCSNDEAVGGDPRSGCALTPTCTLRCHIRHQAGETQLNDALVNSAPNPSGVDHG